MNPLCLLCVFCFWLFVSISKPAEARLISGLGGLVVYDTDLDVTWLGNMRLAATNTFGLPTGSPSNTHSVDVISSGGYMNWYTAQAWVDGMNAENYLGIDNWRLPISIQPDASCSSQSSFGSAGTNCIHSEMGHLFYLELGGEPSTSIFTTGNPAELEKFEYFSSGGYWTGTDIVETAPFVGAYDFYFTDGGQGGTTKNAIRFSTAVADGNPAGLVVPVPATLWLLGSGLFALAGIARRKAT